ncbi:MAG: hypothetical protein HY829_11960 [Actinobacteria bacterium]|nr:hypothetical protein [Actinomycetota bacterium]
MPRLRRSRDVAEKSPGDLVTIAMPTLRSRSVPNFARATRQAVRRRLFQPLGG